MAVAALMAVVVVVAQAALPATTLALGLEVVTAEVLALLEAVAKAVVPELFVSFILEVQGSFHLPTRVTSKDLGHACNQNRRRRTNWAPYSS